MSLRVLLADESDTIKKVFQLALQDLNAEIKSVHSGLDVIDVAQSFQPNIIFADVLLQKKNGYETCREIKQNPNLSRMPVVLMWSSFMELDQDQFKKSRADDQLEKPFDADFLRDLVKKYVPQTKDNPLGQFLNFPKSINAKAEAPLGRNPPATSAVPLAENSTEEDTSEFNIASFIDEGLPTVEENSKFSSAPMPGAPDSPAKDEAWLSADLSKFKLDLEAPADNLEKFEALNLGERSVSVERAEVPRFEVPPPQSLAMDDEAEPKPSSAAGALDQILRFEQSLSPRPGTETKTRHPLAPPVHENTSSKKISTIGLNDDEIEAIIRAHTEEVIKTQVVDSLTDIIERIVRDELAKLLDEEVRLKQDISSDHA